MQQTTYYLRPTLMGNYLTVFAKPLLSEAGERTFLNSENDSDHNCTPVAFEFQQIF